MYIKKMYGYVLPYQDLSELTKGRFDIYFPLTQDSMRWKQWVTKLDLRTCVECSEHSGKIFGINEKPDLELPLHYHCRCRLKRLRAVRAGGATKDGKNGADWWIKHMGVLPDYYIPKQEIENLGWWSGKPPVKYAPGKMIGGQIYHNLDKHLPQSPGRIWYEADINYYGGKRNKHRLLWSNDGLMFVTYDHFDTFIEII